MNIEELKTKIKIKMDEECEIFAVEDALEKLRNLDIDSRAVELDFESVEFFDTAFLQLVVSLKNTLEKDNVKFSVKNLDSETGSKFELYGLSI